MKSTLLTITSIIVGLICFLAIRIIYVDVKASQEVFKPHIVHIQLQPPKGAIQATIKNILGDVKKQGRNDTDFKPISFLTSLVEGESITTGTTGSCTVSFPHIMTLSLKKNTEVDYVSGLPTALVVRQPNGTITYTSSGDIKPFSIRSLGLLTQITHKSVVIITTDPQSQSVLVNVKLGTITLGYSDSNNNTKVQEVTQGHQGFFDDTQSTLTIN